MVTSKSVFNSNFLHGFATSAVQTEGGSRDGGKGSSVWDRYCREGQVFDKSTCDDAAESYKFWERDIDLLADLGANSYRFSISWPRIIPNGQSRNRRNLFYNLADVLGLEQVLDMGSSTRRDLISIRVSSTALSSGILYRL